MVCVGVRYAGVCAAIAMVVVRRKLSECLLMKMNREKRMELSCDERVWRAFTVYPRVN